MRTKLSVAILLLVVTTSCKQPKNKNQPVSKVGLSGKPPTTLVNVPFIDTTVRAETGDTLFYNRSIILFSPNAFVDKHGKPVTGDVQVRYRELVDPIDFYLSGIPMSYDSAGKIYTFESAAMCQLLAYRDGQQVFVNQQSMPEISIVARKDIGGNLYYFDSTIGNWIYKGLAASDLVANIMDTVEKENPESYRENEMPSPPLKPKMANGKWPVIKVVIDSSSFAELKVYDNLEFEIDTSKQKFDPAVTSIEWNDVKLYKRGPGAYLVKFTKGEKSVQYIAQPVLQGKNFDQALVVYNNKMAKYQRLKYERKFNEKLISDRNRSLFEQDSTENKRRQSLRALIEVRNREIRKADAFTISDNIIQTFRIDYFGTWNIDKLTNNNSYPITAIFQDSMGKELQLTNIAVIENRVNAIYRFSNNNIRLMLNADNMIMGVFNKQIAYLSFKDFDAYSIEPGQSVQVFQMRLLPENQHDYMHLKSLMLKD